MNSRRVTAVVVLLLGILLCWWVVSLLTPQQIPFVATAPTKSPPLTPQQLAPQGQTVASYTSTSTLVVHHSVKGLVHTYTGSIMMPSECDSLGSGVSTNGVNPTHVTILLNLFAPMTTCTANPSIQPFTVSVSVTKGSVAPIFDGLSVNGVVAASSIVEQ